jgi:hypothetical protein
MAKGSRPVSVPKASIIVAIIGLVGSIVATVISTTAKSQSETTQNKQTEFEKRFANLKGVDIQSGQCDGMFTEPNWTLGQPEHGGRNIPPKDRRWSRHITFAHPFSAQPVVLLGMSSLDSSCKSDSTRIAIYADNITTTGFDLYLHTWNESEVYGVTAAWIAYQQ